MERHTPSIQTDAKDTYAFHLSLFGALCRTLRINGMESEEIADTFGIPKSILVFFTKGTFPLPTPEDIVASKDVEAIRHYPPFGYMDTDTFNEYRSKLIRLKKALGEEL